MSMTFSEETVKRVGHPSRWHGQRRVIPRSEAGLLSPCSFTLPLIPDTASSLLDSGPPVWCHHSEFWKHWTHSMCLSVWMCFLNHCFSSASDFLFPRKSHYDVSSPGLREKQTDPVPGKWLLPATPAQFPHSQPSYTRDNPELSESCKSIHLIPEKEGITNNQDSCDHITRVPFSVHLLTGYLCLHLQLTEMSQENLSTSLI